MNIDTTSILQICCNSEIFPCSMKLSGTPRLMILFLNVFLEANELITLPKPPVTTPSSIVIISACELKMEFKCTSSKGLINGK